MFCRYMLTCLMLRLNSLVPTVAEAIRPTWVRPRTVPTSLYTIFLSTFRLQRLRHPGRRARQEVIRGILTAPSQQTLVRFSIVGPIIRIRLG